MNYLCLDHDDAPKPVPFVDVLEPSDVVCLPARAFLDPSGVLFHGRLVFREEMRACLQLLAEKQQHLLVERLLVVLQRKHRRPCGAFFRVCKCASVQMHQRSAPVSSANLRLRKLALVLTTDRWPFAHLHTCTLRESASSRRGSCSASAPCRRSTRCLSSPCRAGCPRRSSGMPRTGRGPRPRTRSGTRRGLGLRS